MFVQVHDDHLYGPEVDWWSVGCIMYVMMTGKCPRQEVFVDPKRYAPHLTQAAVCILRKVIVNCSTSNTLQCV